MARKRTLFEEHQADAFLDFLTKRRGGRLALNDAAYRDLAELGYSRADVAKRVNALLESGAVELGHNDAGSLVVTVPGVSEE